MNDPITRIENMVAGWNKETSQDCNPRLYERQLIELIASDPDGKRYPDDCLGTLAKWIKLQNTKASESRFRVKLVLSNVLKDLSKVDSELQLANAWNRNQIKKSAKVEFLESIHRGEIQPNGNVRHVSEILTNIAQKQ